MILRRSGSDVIFDTLFPPSSPAEKMDIEALSGICGSISIACWVVVFSPQIIENFRRHSADGISLLFLAIWLLGDVFNILGAVMQRVLPTMIILAVYYTLADIVLLAQCMYYRGFWPWLAGSTAQAEQHQQQQQHQHQVSGDSVPNDPSEPVDTSLERSPLLHFDDDLRQRRRRSFRERLSSVDGAHLSPTVPMVEPPKVEAPRRAPPTTFQKFVFNTFAIALVCAAGWLGWYISSGSTRSSKSPLPKSDRDELKLDALGQIFGYLCTALYLGSRVPQLLLNYHRKSTEGISLLFFLFACIGNLTFVLSICAYNPICDAQLKDPKAGAGPEICRPGEKYSIYMRYMLVNAPWLLGSLGNLLQDMFIFVQFIMYRNNDKDVINNIHNGPPRRGSESAVSVTEA
ncbi:hypothetical protein KEM54_002548 [Ascosphaera aggregata]|nr:hypothetical protein KEM54_002548 [Ascosphaera aggregata]